MKKVGVRELIVMGVVLVFGVAVAVQASCIDEDFNSLTVGDYHPGTDAPSDIGAYSWSSNGPNTYSIVDGNSSPADPFGGAGNKSLRLYCDTTAGGGKDATARYKNANNESVSGNGELTLKWYWVSGDSMVTLAGTTATENYVIALNLRVKYDGTIRDNIAGVNLDQTMSQNTVYTLEVSFNTDDDTWTAKLNGTLLTHNGSTYVGDLGGSSKDIESINKVMVEAYVSYSAPSTPAESFFDDILLVPEPATIGLLTLGVIGLIKRR